MDRNPESFAEALASGDTDRVNEAIDEIEAVDTADRVDRYLALFEACYPVYESDDGYVRQSVVRFLRDAYPILEIQISASEGERVDGYTIDDLTENRTRLVEFLFEALEDDDGRVRTAAVDGFETLGVSRSTPPNSTPKNRHWSKHSTTWPARSPKRRPNTPKTRNARWTAWGSSGV